MKLLEKTQLGNVNLKNRMAMAAMTRGRTDINGLVGDMTIAYYAQRSGAGLLFSEAIRISEEATGSPLTPGIFTDQQIEAWKKVTTAVHDKGRCYYSPALAHRSHGAFYRQERQTPLCAITLARPGNAAFYF